MRINPDYARLRIVAMVCWILAAWWITQFGSIPGTAQPWLFVAVALSSIVFFAIGIAFWELGNDRRAGILLDNKGIMLNVGHYAAFVTWENIVDVGISQRRDSLLSLGSSYQLGLQLQHPQDYIQSYEERLPAAHGPMGAMLRLLEWALRSIRPKNRAPTLASLAQTRARTGYDILIPETLLGGKAEEFAELLELYRTERCRRPAAEPVQFDHAA